MTIFIGADHRAVDFKNKLVEYLQNKNIRVEDMGTYDAKTNVDYTEFGKKVAQGILQNPEQNMGIVICGSGIGMSMITNRFKGVRCGLCQSVEAAEHGRKNDHINCLALPSEYISTEEAEKIADAFINTPVDQKERYLRRVKQLDE